MRVLSALLHSFHRNGKDERPKLIVGLEEIEQLVLMESGIVDVRVSVKTNATRERLIQIIVLCNGRYKHSKQFAKLQHRIITVVTPRIGGSPAQIQVMRMKNPVPHVSSPDPPLP